MYNIRIKGDIRSVLELTIFFFTKKIVQEEKWGVASVTEIVTLQNYAKLTESCELKFCGL